MKKKFVIFLPLISTLMSSCSLFKSLWNNEGTSQNTNASLDTKSNSGVENSTSEDPASNPSTNTPETPVDAPSTPTNPTNPTEPTKPTEPTEPTDPVEPTPTSYKISFVNYDNSLIYSYYVKEGVIPTYNGPTPTREGTSEIGYRFLGWSPEIVSAISDTTYVATYEEFRQTYQVTFYNSDGTTILYYKIYYYGETPVYKGIDPSYSNDEADYKFVGWDKEITPVTEDTSYVAILSKSVKTYTVKFYYGNNLVQSSVLPYGEKPSYTGSELTKESDETYVYTFVGWSTSPSASSSDAISNDSLPSVVGDATYYAVFSSRYKHIYQIYWKSSNCLLEISYVKEGDKPTRAFEFYRPGPQEYNNEFNNFNNNPDYLYVFSSEGENVISYQNATFTTNGTVRRENISGYWYRTRYVCFRTKNNKRYVYLLSPHNYYNSIPGRESINLIDPANIDWLNEYWSEYADDWNKQSASLKKKNTIYRNI